MRIVFGFSKSGLAAAGLFLLLAAGVFLWLFYSSATNAADSGEGGIWLVPFALPWLLWLPRAIIGPWSGAVCIVFNALMLYCLFGGLRVKRDRP